MKPTVYLERKGEELKKGVEAVADTGPRDRTSVLAYHFLSRVSTLTRYIDIAILAVCLSICPSVTFRY